MADQNLTREELETKELALMSQAKELGASNEEIATLSRREVSEVEEMFPEQNRSAAPTAFDYFHSAVNSIPPGHTEAYVKSNALKLSALNAIDAPDMDADMVYEKAYKQVSGSFINQTMDAAFQSYADKMTSEIEQMVHADLAVNPGNAEVHASTLSGLEATKGLYEGVAGRNRMLVDAYYDESFADRSRRQIESQMVMGDYFTQQAEERGVLDKITDGVGLIFDPLSNFFDIGDLVDIDPTAKGNTRYEQLKNIVGGWQSIDPELQKELTPIILDKAWEAFGNNEFKVGAFVGLLNDPDFEESIRFGANLDTIEAGGILAPLAAPIKALKGLKNALNLRTIAKNMGNKKAAITATRNQQSKVDNAMDADPMEWEDTLMGATTANDDMAEAYLDMHKRIKEEVSAPTRELLEEDAFIKVDSLRPAEKEAAIQKQLDRLNEAEPKDGVMIKNAAVSETNDKGFKITYEVAGEAGDEKRIMDIKWSRDDAGSLIGVDEEFDNVLKSTIGSKLLSPDVVLRSLDDQLVNDVTFAGLQSATLRNSLAQVWKNTEKSLKSIPTVQFKKGQPIFARADARRAIDELLIAGDESGTVWKVEDLRAGNVQTLSGKRKFTDAEIEAYYAKRAFLDEAHGLQNKLVKDKLDFLGYKEASWIDPHTQQKVTTIGKPKSDFRGLDKTDDILDTSDNKVWKVSDYDGFGLEDGQQIVTLLKPMMIDGRKINRVVVNTLRDGDQIADLPAQVLNRVPGYVPRISKPGYMYVKNVDTGDTIARFKTKENAEAYAAQQMARMNADLKSGETATRLHAFRDRDFNAIDTVIEDSNAYGGLYTGARSKDGIFAGDDLAGEVTRLSAGQSINRMMDSVSFQMPLNEYRTAVVQRWKATAMQALRNEGLENTALAKAINSEDEWADVSLSAINNNSVRNMLESHRQYMKDALKVAHRDENRWAQKMMDIADAIPNGKARDLVVSVASKNPIQALKGATFDAYLGWFNPRQLYVQAQNAALAASMYPKQAALAVPEAFIQRIALYTKAIDRDMLRKAANGMITDEKGFDDLVLSLEQFKRSGLRDGVMRTGDYSSNVAGFSTGTLDTFRKASAAGRVFFEEGESMARLISWNIARRNWKAANPGKAIDDTAIRQITDDTLRMNMNMQRENAAWWQKNPITAIPTQFLQVQAKLAENVVGGLLGNGKWTRKEAASVLAGQIMLYGTGGVIIAEDAAGFMKEKISGDQAGFDIANPTWGEMLDRGMTGVFMSSLGFQNNFSESASILAGMDDNFAADMIVTFADLVKGDTTSIQFKAPSIGVVKRGSDAMSSTYQAMVDIVVAPSVATVGDSVIKSIDSFASITSTWSNARKAMFLHKFGEIRDSRGNIVAHANQTEDMNIQTVLAKAMGFTTDIEDAYYKQKSWNMDRKKMEQDTSKALNKIFLEFRNDQNLEKYQANLSLIMSEYEDRPLVRDRLLNDQIKRIMKPRSGVERELKRFILDYIKSGGAIGTQSFQSQFINEEQ